MFCYDIDITEINELYLKSEGENIKEVSNIIKLIIFVHSPTHTPPLFLVWNKIFYEIQALRACA